MKGFSLRMMLNTRSRKKISFLEPGSKKIKDRIYYDLLFIQQKARLKIRLYILLSAPRGVTISDD